MLYEPKQSFSWDEYIGGSSKALLAGKGWGIDKIDFVSDPVVAGYRVRIGINEIAAAVPYSVAVAYDPDPVLRLRDLDFRGPVVTSDWVWVTFPVIREWLNERDAQYYIFTRAEFQGAIPGTAPVALTMLARAGVKEILMVGFDLYFRPRPSAGDRCNPYAKAVSPLYGSWPVLRVDGTKYDRINEVISSVVERWGLHVEEYPSPYGPMGTQGTEAPEMM